MKNILKASILLLFLAIGTLTNAQDVKYGYVNSQELIILLPESKTADSEIEAYQKKLATDFKKKVEKFQADVKAVEAQVAEGKLNQIQIQEQGGALGKREQDLAKEEQALAEKVNDKRLELLKPILERIDKAIKEVGKEGNYTMIFDSSGMNVMLYLDESHDVGPLVKAKLGL